MFGMFWADGNDGKQMAIKFLENRAVMFFSGYIKICSIYFNTVYIYVIISS